MANFFTKLFSEGASNLVEAVGDAIDKNVTTDAERKELENEQLKAALLHDVEMAGLSLDDRKAVLGDSASAREHQSTIQTSEHASWLSKNVHPILGVGILGLTFSMYFWILRDNATILSQENGMKEIVIYILGALTTVSTQVAAFYFGSSQGSKDKNTVLQRIVDKG